jgi:hypothetical protein
MVSQKTNRKTTERDWVSVCVGSNRKKINCFEDPPIENVFWRFFRFVSTKFCLSQLFRYQSKTPNQTEKNDFWFRKTNRKTTETDWVSLCFASNRKKIWLFRGHPTLDLRRLLPQFLFLIGLRLFLLPPSSWNVIKKWCPFTAFLSSLTLLRYSLTRYSRVYKIKSVFSDVRLGVFLPPGF